MHRYLKSSSVFAVFYSGNTLTFAEEKNQSLKRVKSSRIPQYDIVIIGGGIVGSSLAYHLRHVNQTHKPSVLLVDQSICGGGASGLSAGTIWSVGQSSKDFVMEEELCGTSEKIYRHLNDTGFEIGWRSSGTLTLACTKEESEHLRAEYEHLVKSGYTVEFLSDTQAICEVEPALLGSNAISALHAPLSGYVEPLQATRAFVEAAECTGARIVENARVTSIIPLRHSPTTEIIEMNYMERERSPCFLVQTESGNSFQARHVVLCAGLGIPGLLLPLGLEVPIAPVLGTMWESNSVESSVKLKKVLYVAESALYWERNRHLRETKEGIPAFCTHDLQGEMLVRHCYGRPSGRGDGVVYFGGGRKPVSTETVFDSDQMEIDSEIINTVFNQVKEFYPALGSAGLSGGEWCGLMPFSKDGKPLVGRFTRLLIQESVGLNGKLKERFSDGTFEGLWIAGGFGGEGMMLGPGAMKYLAEEINNTITINTHHSYKNNNVNNTNREYNSNSQSNSAEKERRRKEVNLVSSCSETVSPISPHKLNNLHIEVTREQKGTLDFEGKSSKLKEKQNKHKQYIYKRVLKDSEKVLGERKRVLDFLDPCRSSARVRLVANRKK